MSAGDVKTLVENGWREQSSMSQLFEKLIRAAEVLADPKAEDDVSDDEKGVKVKKNVVQKVESIFKKPHRAAGKLTLSERKFGEKKEWTDKMRCSERTIRRSLRSRQRGQKG